MATKPTIDLTTVLANAVRGLRLSERVGALPNVASQRTQELKGRVKGAKATVSVCPYCAVGCSTLAYTNAEGKLLDVEGNPDSPISGGHLCPEGLGDLRPHRQRSTLDDREISRPVRDRMGREAARLGARSRRGTDEENARRDVRANAAEREAGQSHARHRVARRRDFRRRRELSAYRS